MKERFEEEKPDYIKQGIHVMVSQNQVGELTIGDSHIYGLSPDPFDYQEINQQILEYLFSFADLQDALPVESWNGVYAKLKNGETDLFFSPEPGVYILNAMDGAGMTLSFGLAEDRLNSVLFCFQCKTDGSSHIRGATNMDSLTMRLYYMFANG